MKTTAVGIVVSLVAVQIVKMGGGDCDGGTALVGDGEGDDDDACCCCCAFEFCAKVCCVESLMTNPKLAIMPKDSNPKKNTKPIFKIPMDICTQSVF